MHAASMGIFRGNTSNLCVFGIFGFFPFLTLAWRSNTCTWDGKPGKIRRKIPTACVVKRSMPQCLDPIKMLLAGANKDG